MHLKTVFLKFAVTMRLRKLHYIYCNVGVCICHIAKTYLVSSTNYIFRPVRQMALLLLGLPLILFLVFLYSILNKSDRNLSINS